MILRVWGLLLRLWGLLLGPTDGQEKTTYLGWRVCGFGFGFLLRVRGVVVRAN